MGLFPFGKANGGNPSLIFAYLCWILIHDVVILLCSCHSMCRGGVSFSFLFCFMFYTLPGSRKDLRQSSLQFWKTEKFLLQ